MNFVPELVRFLRTRAGHRPVALNLSTASWPIGIALRREVHELAAELHDGLSSAFPDANILLPTFTNGFGPAGLSDLDAEPATTGVINEFFRTSPGFARTRSAFFSFAVAGPDRDLLADLRPVHAWGDDSLYSWMHERDIDLVTVGVHPSHTSFLHLSEWRMKSPYRYAKRFEGQIRYAGAVEALTETLFVRCLDPSPVNDFTKTLPAMVERGLSEALICGIRVSHVRARAAIHAIDDLLFADPYAIVKNRGDFDHAQQ